MDESENMGAVAPELPNGLMIVLEGIDCAGKTTQMARIHEQLVADGYDVVRTREPGGTEFAERIRALVLDKDHDEPVDPIAELLLFFAARRQHVVNLIKPALDAGKVVLCDRFVNSTMAYQVIANGLPVELFFALMQYTVINENTVPHATFILDISDELSLERLASRTEEQNRLDFGDKEKRALINNTTRQFAGVPGHYLIDGSKTRDEVFNDIYPNLTKIIDEYYAKVKNKPSS